jgi:hypothetical protein
MQLGAGVQDVVSSDVSAPTDLIQEVQDVVSSDVEAPTPRGPIKACHRTEKFTLLTTE